LKFYAPAISTVDGHAELSPSRRSHRLALTTGRVYIELHTALTLRRVFVAIMGFALDILKSKRLVLLGVFLGFAAAAVAGATPSPGNSNAAEFYRGKTVRIVVGFPAGGGYDAYSRLIARHLGKQIPGNPTVIVDNMAGAGSIVAANHVYHAAIKDGTVIGNVSGPIILEQLFGNPAAQFDMAKFHYLGVPAAEVYLMLVSRRSGITRLDDLLGAKPRQATIGGIPNTTIEHAPLLMREVIGTNIKVVSGYKGSADIRLAIDSGEIDGFFNTWTSAKIAALELIRGGEWRILAQLTDIPLSDLPDSMVPKISGITKHEDQRQLLRLGSAVPSQFAKTYVMAPGVPEERIQAMAAALMQTWNDKEFLHDAEKAKVEISPISGNKTKALVRQFLGMPAEVKLKLQKIIHGQR